jgi:predicted permease
MKFAMIAAVLMTLPAIAALVFSIMWGNQYLMYAAFFSFALNSLPFLVAGLMMRNRDTSDFHH